MIAIRQLGIDDMDTFWPVRYRALTEHPDAFGSSADEVRAWPAAQRQDLVTNRYLDGENVIIGAFSEDGQLVGMTGVVRLTSAKVRHRAEIWGVYVAPEARGQGVAARLFAAAEAYLLQLDGVRQVHLAVSSHNRAAIATYARAGFVLWGTEPRALIVDGQPVDEDHMVLVLDR